MGIHNIQKDYIMFQTKMVQSGRGKDNTTGAVSFPIYQMATFEHPELSRSTGFDYTRSGNPTRQVLEEAVAHLEGGIKALACGSGMSAITILLMQFKPGDHLIFTNDLYGGTYRLVKMILENWGLKSSFVEEAVAQKMLSRVELMAVAVSLGGVESILSYPKTMSHGGMSEEERLAIGVGGDLVRLSVGLEGSADLIQDLRQALEGVNGSD